MVGPVRLAIIGGRRGGGFQQALNAFVDRIRLAAVCDTDQDLLERWRSARPGLSTFEDYAEVLNEPGIDAVLLATPMGLHARQALSALNSGKHVLSEVIAATTLDECWDLIEAVRQWLHAIAI